MNIALRYKIMPMILSLACTCGGSAACAKEPSKAIMLPAHFHLNTPYADLKDPFTLDLIVWLVKGKPCVKFESSSPVTGRGSSFTAPGVLTGNTLTLTFTDDWGTKGKGKVVFKKRSVFMHLEVVAMSPRGINAAESWPDHEDLPRVKLDPGALPKKCCNPGED